MTLNRRLVCLLIAIVAFVIFTILSFGSVTGHGVFAHPDGFAGLGLIFLTAAMF